MGIEIRKNTLVASLIDVIIRSSKVDPPSDRNALYSKAIEYEHK